MADEWRARCLEDGCDVEVTDPADAAAHSADAGHTLQMVSG